MKFFSWWALMEIYSFGKCIFEKSARGKFCSIYKMSELIGGTLTRGTVDMHQVWLDLFICSFTQNASAICKELYRGSLVMKGSICITVLKTGDSGSFNLALIMQEQIKLSVCIRCDLSYNHNIQECSITDHRYHTFIQSNFLCFSLCFTRWEIML